MTRRDATQHNSAILVKEKQAQREETLRLIDKIYSQVEPGRQHARPEAASCMRASADRGASQGCRVAPSDASLGGSDVVDCPQLAPGCLVYLCTCALSARTPLLACLPRRHVDTWQVEELKAKVAKLQKARPKNAEASMGPRALAMQVCLCSL